MKYFIAVLLLISNTVFANNFIISDINYYNDPDTESVITFYGLGHETSGGYLISGGGFSMYTFEQENESRHGSFLGLQKRFKNHSIATRLKYSSDGGVRGNLNFKANAVIDYEVECMNRSVESSSGIRNEITYNGCILTAGKDFQRFGVHGTIGQLDFSDDNSRNITNLTAFFDFNKNLRIQGFHKHQENDFRSANYFSPEEWTQNYAKLYYAENMNDIYFRVGAGFGIEEIDGRSHDTVYAEARIAYDRNDYSIFLQIQYKSNNDVDFTYTTLNFRKGF